MWWYMQMPQETEALYINYSYALFPPAMIAIHVYLAPV